MGSPDLSRIHPTLKTIARNLPRVARQAGFSVRITSGYRSRSTQAKLYRDYINGISQYPANPPGYSKHEKGLALDILSTDPTALVSLLTSVGLVWAGPDDAIHFEMPGKIALGSSRTRKVAPAQVVKAPKKKSLTKKVLGAASWVPGPVGWAATALDWLW